MDTYSERYLFTTRVTTLDGTTIIATGRGLRGPRYNERFAADTLAPVYSELHLANGSYIRPLIFLTLFLVILFFVIMDLKLTDSGLFLIVGLAAITISGLATIVTIFIRQRWILFKYRSGVHAFTIGPGGGSDAQEQIATRIAAVIASTPNPADPAPPVSPT